MSFGRVIPIDPETCGESFPLLNENVVRILSGNAPRHTKPKLIQIDSRKQMLAFAHQHRRHGQMHLVDLPRKKILPDGRHASADAHVLSCSRFPSALQCRVSTVGNEVKRSPALHGERLPRMMRQHKHGNVIRRFVAPPSLPRLVRPWATHRTKHVPPQNPRPDILKGALGHLIVDAATAAALPLHLLPDVGLKEPGKHFRPAYPERILQVLPSPSPETVDRNRKRSHPNFAHNGSMLR